MTAAAGVARVVLSSTIPKNLKLVRETLQVKRYRTIQARTGEAGQIPDGVARELWEWTALEESGVRCLTILRFRGLQRVR